MINIKYYSFVRPETGNIECIRTIPSGVDLVKVSVPLYDYGLAENVNVGLLEANENELENLFPHLKEITKEEYLKYAKGILSERQYKLTYGETNED